MLHIYKTDIVFVCGHISIFVVKIPTMKDLKLIRKYVNSKELKEKYNLENSYKTIEAVLYGLRKNNHILELALKLAKENLLKDLLQLQEIKITPAQSRTPAQSKLIHPFIEMDIQQKIESLCKMKLKEIQELKKELIKLNLFDSLENEVQGFLKDLKTNSLKLLQYNRRF
jgi:hypothetical protein